MNETTAGLTQKEAEEKLKESGPNRLAKTSEVKFFNIVWEEIREPMILLLFVVGFFYTLWGKLEDAITIFIVIFLLVLAEVWNEYRAKKTIKALSKLAVPKTKVLRDGKVAEIGTEKIVPGDVLILVPGTRIAADARLLVSYSVEADESPLTGESLPVEKKTGGEIYAGTLVMSGEGRAEVFATGAGTRFGKIAKLAAEIKEPKTPLQLAMKSLSKTLVWVALFFSFVIPLVGFLRGGDFREMVLTGLSLSFATIPEELPIIITMILGLGAYTLSKKNFLVKKIKAAEILGGATVILTDKTGTITENRMKAVSVYPQNQEAKILKIALASFTEMSLSPTDKAILEKARELKIGDSAGKIIRERSFGDRQKTKAIIRELNGGVNLVITGAPEEIIKIAGGGRAGLEEELRKEAARGRRVVGVGYKALSPAEKNRPFAELEKDLELAGLIALEDPPRFGVKETVALAKRAGIRTIMVTGDHPQTADYVAASVGIPSGKTLTGADLDKLDDEQLELAVKEVSVFARTAPEHKYRLVKALRQNGEAVAVTGDGVNDSLALKAADIGIAMGIKGTDAAKEAADVILTDDNFITIGQGIFEGRKFHDNLRKGVKYYLAVKFALISIFLLPALFNVPFPFSPIQIIVLELFMDIAASAGFVAEPAERSVYTRPPRNPKEKFLDHRMLRGIAVSGLSLFAAVTVSYFYARWQNLSVAQTQTFAFTAWIMGHIFLAFVSRSEREPFYRLGFFTNKLMNIWALAAIVFLFAGIQVPLISAQLRLQPLAAGELALVSLVAFVAISWQELVKVVSFKQRRQAQ